jgi:hypothetical protein
LLIVRHRAGDPLDDRELATARDLITTCIDCAALVDELDLISRATATATFPSRPRDFRIAPDDVVRLRSGSRMRRVRDWFRAPGSVVLRPLAGAALGIGLVLVAVGATIPDMGAAPERDSAPAADLVLNSTAPAPVTASSEAAEPSSLQQRTGGTDANPEVMVYLQSPGADEAAGPDGVMLASESPAPSDATSAARLATPEPVADQGNAGEMAPATPRQDGLSDAILVLGLLLSVAAAAALLLSWIAGRLPRQARQ